MTGPFSAASRRRRPCVLIAIILAIITVSLVLWRRATGQRAAPGGRGSPATAEAVVTRRLVDTTVTATGVIRPRVGAQVRVGSQVSGVVRSLRVTEGSHIQRGETIAVIDARAIEARLAEARAQVAIDEIETRRATLELTRAQRLAASGLVPRQQIDDLGLAAESAQAKLAKSRAEVAMVATDLANTVLRSPISGTVLSVSTQEGETVAASFAAPTFVTILADDVLQLVAVVDETDIGAVRPGNPVTFTVEAFPTRELAGRVTRIAPQATIVSGVVNYDVTIDLADSANDLKPDMTANVSIQTSRHPALLLPAAAVGRDGDSRFVRIAGGDGRFTKRIVRVGSGATSGRDAGLVEIESGVREGDRVASRAAPSAAASDSEE